MTASIPGQPNTPSAATTPASPPPAPVVVTVQQLFQGQREIAIDHEGVRYRLRLTRRNKLILQK